MFISSDKFNKIIENVFHNAFKTGYKLGANTMYGKYAETDSLKQGDSEDVDVKIDTKAYHVVKINTYGGRYPVTVDLTLHDAIAHLNEANRKSGIYEYYIIEEF